MREDFDYKTRFDLKTKVGEFVVSTVDMGFNEETSKMLGYTYETMIFREQSGKFLEYQERYKTEEEARKGHQEAIEYIKK